MLITPGKPYTTRAGDAILVTNLAGPKSHPIVGIDKTKKFVFYTKEGYFVNAEYAHPLDLTG